MTAGSAPPPLDVTKSNWIFAYIFVGIIIPIGYLIIIGIITIVDRHAKESPSSDSTRRPLDANGSCGRTGFPCRDAARITEPETANSRAVEGPQTDEDKDMLRQLQLQRETQGWVSRPLGVHQQQHEANYDRSGGDQSSGNDDDPYLSYLKETGLGRSSMDGPYGHRDSLYSIDVEKDAGATPMAPSPMNPYSDINPYQSSNHNHVQRSVSSSTDNTKYRHSFDVHRNPFSDDNSVVDLTGNCGGSFRQQRQPKEIPYGDEEQSCRNPFSNDHDGSRRPMSLYEEPLRRPDPSYLV